MELLVQSLTQSVRVSPPRHYIQKTEEPTGATLSEEIPPCVVFFAVLGACYGSVSGRVSESAAVNNCSLGSLPAASTARLSSLMASG